jgi:hypothetical protein
MSSQAHEYIDESLYPDEPAPIGRPLTDFEKAEHIHRVCAAWEFDILPEDDTLRTIAGWKDILDRFPLANHLAYHAIRLLLRMPPVPAHILELPYERLDAIEGKEDVCADLV